MSKTTKDKRSINDKEKLKILRKQDFKCANTPGSKLYNLDNYECPMWKYNNGSFDKSGFEADHIIEYCLTQNSSLTNMQLLCHSCHAQKSRNFSENRSKSKTNNIQPNNIQTNNIQPNNIGRIAKSYVNGKLLYTCPKCTTEFNHKTKFDLHMDRKTECKPVTGKKLKNKKSFHYPCDICKCTFGRLDVLQCHFKSISHQEKEKIFLEQNNDSKNKVKKTNKSHNKKSNNNSKNTNNTNKTNTNTISSNNTNTNNNTNCNNITISPNFYLYPFGSEDISVLSKDDKISILDSKISPLTDIVLKTDLDPDLPKFQNLDVIRPITISQYKDAITSIKYLEDFLEDNRKSIQKIFGLTGKKIKQQNNIQNQNQNQNPNTDSDSGIIPKEQLSPYLLMPSYEEQVVLVKACEGSALKILNYKYSKNNRNENYKRIRDMIKNVKNYRRLNIIIRIILRSALTVLTVDFINQKIEEEIEMQNSINAINAVSVCSGYNDDTDNDFSYELDNNNDFDFDDMCFYSGRIFDKESDEQSYSKSDSETDDESDNECDSETDDESDDESDSECDSETDGGSDESNESDSECDSETDDNSENEMGDE